MFGALAHKMLKAWYFLPWSAAPVNAMPVMGSEAFPSRTCSTLRCSFSRPAWRPKSPIRSMIIDHAFAPHKCTHFCAQSNWQPASGLSSLSCAQDWQQDEALQTQLSRPVGRTSILSRARACYSMTCLRSSKCNARTCESDYSNVAHASHGIDISS